MTSTICQNAGDHAILFGNIGHVSAINILKINSLHGDLVQAAFSENRQQAQPRLTPIHLQPHPFGSLLGRRDEVKSALNELPYEQPVEFYGSAGIGKTSLLRYLAHHPSITHAFPDGIIYHHSAHHQPVSDILQILFDAFYETTIPVKPTDIQIRDALKNKKALILLDGLQLSREEIEILRNYLPGLTFLFATFERQLWGEGRSVELRGLTLSEGLALITRELGRSLSTEERPGAEAICTALAGHPLRILQAVALANEEKLSLAAIAQRFTTTSLEKNWITQLLSPRQQTQRVVVTLLAAIGANVALDAERIADIIQIPDAKLILETLQRQHLVQIEGDHYHLAHSIAEELQQFSNLTPWLEHAITYFTQWVQQIQGNPEYLLKDADAIVQILAQAVDTGRWADVLCLSKGIEGTFALSGQWGTWQTVLQSMLEAARVVGDHAAEALALHQLGTRSLCLGEVGQAQADLNQALQIRQNLLHDSEAAAVTQHNLDFLANLSNYHEPEPSFEPEQKHSGREIPVSLMLKAGLFALLLAISCGLLIARCQSSTSPGSSPSPTDTNSPSSTPTGSDTPTVSPTRKPPPPVPTINFFEANPAKISVDESSQLCYDITNAVSASIKGIGAVKSVAENCISVTPKQTTTYTLIAQGRNNQQTQPQSVTVTVINTPPPPPPPIPTINLFNANPPKISIGESSQLCYSMTNAVSASIEGIGTVKPVAENCISVTPKQTTTYTLIATGLNNQQTQPQSRTVTVINKPPPVPTINFFEATPAKISIGESSQLCYGMINAVSASIEGIGEVKPVAENCISVTPKQTTTYTLIATGRNNQQTRPQSATVTVISQPPKILSFEVSFYQDPNPTAVIRRRQLCYEIANATSAKIEPEIGELTNINQGCVKIYPQQTTIYVLTAIGSDGQKDEQKVTVTLPQLPR